MGIFDKLKGKVKSGVEGVQKSSQERKAYRNEINLIRREERVKQEKKHAKFMVQEEYRQKRKNVKAGGGDFSLDKAILGESRSGREGRDPMSDLILGAPQKPKTKRERRSKKTQPQIIVVVQESKKKKKRKKRK